MKSIKSLVVTDDHQEQRKKIQQAIIIAIFLIGFSLFGYFTIKSLDYVGFESAKKYWDIESRRPECFVREYQIKTENYEYYKSYEVDCNF